MVNISSELKRINGTLLIMMIIILLGSCAGGEVTVDYPEDVNEMETEKMVDLGDGYFGNYTGFELKIIIMIRRIMNFQKYEIHRRGMREINDSEIIISLILHNKH